MHWKDAADAIADADIAEGASAEEDADGAGVSQVLLCGNATDRQLKRVSCCIMFCHCYTTDTTRCSSECY